ncbi:unnamed protein product [Rhizophagus irregularis]|nr:unnamed protein product [Rhizophagus irregularis]
MSLLWKLRFCLRFTLQTHGILTESLDIPNDPYVMYTNPQGEITTALNIACHKSLFNKNYPPHIIICILGSMGPIYGEIKGLGTRNWVFQLNVDKIGDNRPSIKLRTGRFGPDYRRFGLEPKSKSSFTEKILFYRDRRFLNSLDEGLWRLRHGSW